jgi:hypothetical protein
MKIIRLTGIRRWSLLVSFFVLCGCAGPNLYSINMYYDAEQTAVPEYLKADVKAPGNMISVAEFTDTRQIDDRLVIGRVVEKNGESILVFPRNVRATRVISSAINQYFKKAGYRVSGKTEQWNLKESTIPEGDGKILIGGNIDDLEISCRRGFPTNSYNANIKLTIVFADMEKGKILYKRQVQSNYTQEHAVFSENILGEQASAVLADAIEKLFEDKAVAQKLKEAMIR